MATAPRPVAGVAAAAVSRPAGCATGAIPVPRQLQPPRNACGRPVPLLQDTRIYRGSIGRRSGAPAVYLPVPQLDRPCLGWRLGGLFEHGQHLASAAEG